MSIDNPSIIIIGAGFSGMCIAIKLKQAGFSNFIILEKDDGVGGVWRTVNYPNAGCDVPSFLYCYSFAPNPNWSRKYAKQAEILSYAESCADRYGLRSHLRLHSEVESATYDSEACMWDVMTKKGDSYRANILIGSTGVVQFPKFPKIEGMSKFSGDQFHCAQWDHDLDLTGKRVGIIGSGASAVQFLIPVQAQAKQVTLFQRSPNWILPKGDRPISPLETLLFRRLPFLATLYHYYLYFLFELRWPILSKYTSPLNRLAQRRFGRQLSKRLSHPELLKDVKPDYSPGCKRILISDDFYETLKKSNVRLETAPIDHIDETAVVTQSQDKATSLDAYTSSPSSDLGARDLGKSAHLHRHELDVLIFATGFRATEFYNPMELRGLNGISLRQAWKEGAEAYRGIVVNQFPNFFIIGGPNTGLGHNSVITMVENECRYIMSCIHLMKQQKIRSLHVRADVQRHYNQWLDRKMVNTVWQDKRCHSWYRTAGNKVVIHWPGFASTYAWSTRRANLADFELEFEPNDSRKQLSEQPQPVSLRG